MAQQMIQPYGEEKKKIKKPITPKVTNTPTNEADRYRDEIIRKAQQGIALTNPTDEKMAIYNQYKPQEVASVNVPQPTSTPQTSYADTMKSYVNDRFDNSRNALISQLNASREKALGQYNQQKENLNPTYQGLKNRSDVTFNQNVQRLREIMGNMGLTKSGENVTRMGGLLGSRQVALDNYDLQKQQEINDINRKIGDLYNPNDEMAILANNDAQRNQMLLDAYQNAIGRQDKLTQQDFTNNMALENQQFSQEMAKLQFEEDARRFGLNYALDQYQANTSRMNAQTNQGSLQQRQAEFEAQQNQQNPTQDTGIDEYDLLTVDSLANDAGINYDNATPQEMQMFIAGLKAQYGWNTDEANRVYQYMVNKSQLAQQQRNESNKKSQQALEEYKNKLLNPGFMGEVST